MIKNYRTLLVKLLTENEYQNARTHFSGEEDFANYILSMPIINCHDWASENLDSPLHSFINRRLKDFGIQGFEIDRSLYWNCFSWAYPAARRGDWLLYAIASYDSAIKRHGYRLMLIDLGDDLYRIIVVNKTSLSKLRNIKSDIISFKDVNNISKNMTKQSKASLFGQKYSNRDYSKAKYWGKNQFNSSFPASLVAYMSSKGMDAVYLCTDSNNKVIHSTISGTDILGINPLSDNAYYNFEAGFFPYEQFYYTDTENDKKENIDLVMIDRSTNLPLRGLEVKLTALPDNTTAKRTEDNYSCEIVVRPPTICFLACSICKHYSSAQDKERLRNMLLTVPKINHWGDVGDVAPRYAMIRDAVLNVAKDMADHQTPLILQPVWKTEGKAARLADDCLDVFVWSNLATLQMCCVDDDAANNSTITRFQRAIIWVYLMLWEYVTYGKFDYVKIVKDHSYDTANDKAFSLPGQRSHQFLTCAELTHPRIKKSEIKNIILGGGQNFLSPERRFDAVIVSSPDLFN
ncbi:MAG: HindVP family restriction endonuclease [Bacteroidaceae bacterium]|nr:HindVP family restriction endonuclease [Bacteroidaceae bacterium]